MGFIELQDFFKSHLKSMLVSGILLGVLVSVALITFEKPYAVRTDFLMVQQNTNNQDFYTLFKSSEYLGKVLSQAIYSERFIDAVIETGKVNADFFPKDKKDRLDTWAEMIDVKKNLELGILNVSVKSERERDAARVLDAVSEVLIQKNELFRAGDQKNVEIRILSGPISEQTPSKEKIAAVFLGGLISGMLFVGCMAAIRSGRRNSRLILDGRHDFKS